MVIKSGQRSQEISFKNFIKPHINRNIAINKSKLVLGLSKSEIFTERLNRISAFAKALSHPARLAILEHLFKQDTCVCGDLVEEIGLAQPTISQHLKELKNLGLIKGTIQGTRVCYCLDTQNWESLGLELDQFLKQNVIDKQDCC